MPEGYKDDLAYIHDAGFGHYAANAARVLRDALRGKFAGGLVIDLGCGSGILAQKLTGAGYDVLGIDQSAAMIALARKRAPKAHFQHQSFVSAQLPPCVAVTAIGEIFNYLFDGSNTMPRLRNLLRRIFQALSPGGLLLFDVDGPGRGSKAGRYQVFREGKDWAVLADIEEDRSQNLLTRKIIS